MFHSKLLQLFIVLFFGAAPGLLAQRPVSLPTNNLTGVSVSLVKKDGFVAILSSTKKSSKTLWIQAKIRIHPQGKTVSIDDKGAVSSGILGRDGTPVHFHLDYAMPSGAEKKGGRYQIKRNTILHVDHQIDVAGLPPGNYELSIASLNLRVDGTDRSIDLGSLSDDFKTKVTIP